MVHVVWDDHSTFHEVCWRSLDAVRDLKPVEVVTIGFLIKEAHDHIVVQSTMATDDLQGAHETLILRGTIKSIVRLGFGARVANRLKGAV